MVKICLISFNRKFIISKENRHDSTCVKQSSKTKNTISFVYNKLKKHYFITNTLNTTF